MPTRYTVDVQTGKITEFSDFAMCCARAFGALIMMRDDPLDASITDAAFKVSTYHEAHLDDAKAELARLEAMTADEAEAAAAAAHLKSDRSWLARQEDRALHRGRYEEMLAATRAWTPPTPDHADLKRFMDQQLVESIKHDCSSDYDERPRKQTGAEWHSAAIERANWKISHHTKHHEDEVGRQKSRAEWVRALQASLSPSPSNDGERK